jgi:hypothetical protein
MSTKSHKKTQKRADSKYPASFTRFIARLFVSFCAFSWPSFAPAQRFNFDDIQFWVGNGANRAALVIDWVDDSPDPPSLVWGYRWDGNARGSDMLLAIISADNRLFAKLGGAATNPNAVFGLGYDADGDGQFALDDGATFDKDGIAFTSPADLATSVDPDDYYAEGWFTGFWHYGVAAVNPYGDGAWADSHEGMATRMLTDGAWDSWTFSPSFDFTAFAHNPSAAPPPFLPGDYDRDGQVAPADYGVWRSSFGSNTVLAADGNGNGVIDAADYVVWRKQFATAPGFFAVSPQIIPEPSTHWLPLCVLCVVCPVRQIKRKERIS